MFCFFADINECESDTKRCSRNAECVNIEGSYQCICKQGYEVRGAECRGNLFLTLVQQPRNKQRTNIFKLVSSTPHLTLDSIATWCSMQMRKVLDFEDEVNTDIVMVQAIQIMDSASYRLVNSINLDSSYPLRKDKLGRALNMSSPQRAWSTWLSRRRWCKRKSHGDPSLRLKTKTGSYFRF